MDSFRIFNGVTHVEPIYKIGGLKVSKPVGMLFFVYVVAVSALVMYGSVSGNWIPMFVVGVSAGIVLAAVVILDAKLRSYGLRDVMVQIRLLYDAARKPMNRNY